MGISNRHFIGHRPCPSPWFILVFVLVECSCRGVCSAPRYVSESAKAAEAMQFAQIFHADGPEDGHDGQLSWFRRRMNMP
jgi:hypothetical protein